MIRDYPNGTGQALGDILATCRPLRTSGNIWYVNSATGSDAASPRGENDARPLATLGQAITNAAQGDIIVLMDGHAETLSADTTIPANTTVVGGGLSGGLPTVKIAFDATHILALSTRARLHNVWIQTRTSAGSNNRVQCAGSNVVRGCYFECSATDTGPGLVINGDNCRVETTTFVSTATSSASQPESALKTATEAVMTVLRMVGVVFDGGTSGFSNFYACDLGFGEIDEMELEQISLLRGADMKCNAASTGFVNIAQATGGARVDW